MGADTSSRLRQDGVRTETLSTSCVPSGSVVFTSKRRTSRSQRQVVASNKPVALWGATMARVPRGTSLLPTRSE